MSRLETAMSRLDTAMARLDAAVNQSAERGDRDRDSMEQELAALRRTHALLQEEARLVSDRLDHAVGRLQNVMAGSLCGPLEDLERDVYRGMLKCRR